jgi:beta-lactamase regulating signal transducer with metallopeptidase domain
MSPFATALGLALLHFVWQGFFLGALIAGTLAALRERPASVRYVVCVGGMALLFAAPVATTLLILRAPPGEWVLPILHGTRVASSLVSPLLPILPVLPIVWGAGVIALQVRMIVAWIRAESLGRIGTRAASARWQREFEDLVARFSVDRPVRLLESSRVVVPAVVGWLRPVVLVPASLATGLSPGEIRGLLAHELAHVRRHDYAVNVAQCLFESLLFFHPVTWWLSGRLRAEREFCCDDVALTVGGGALAYARTLSSLEELRDRTALPVLSAKGGSLMTRITRLLGGGPHGHGRAALALGIVAVTGGITLGALMATGCFQGESVAAVESETLVGPGSEQAATAFAPEPADVSQVLATLDAAVAAGRLSAEAAATIRTKIESGEAKFFSASYTSAGGCGTAANCAPADCEPSACVELTGSGEGEPMCVVIECDESACMPTSAVGSDAPIVEAFEVVELGK